MSASWRGSSSEPRWTSVDRVERSWAGADRLRLLARGHLSLACKPAHYEDFVRAAEVLSREFAHEVRPLARADLRREIGSGIYFGGLVDEASAGINPAQYVLGLARAARAAGARFTSTRRSSASSVTVPGWRVIRLAAHSRPRTVLVATSGYTGARDTNAPPPEDRTDRLVRHRHRAAAGNAGARSEPARSHDVRLASFPALLSPDAGPPTAVWRTCALPCRRPMPRCARARPCFIDGMLEVFPQLRDVRVEYAWGGTLDFAFDTLPHAGKLEGLHYALGYAGHGVALAT